jgi:hypothetical protein
VLGVEGTPGDFSTPFVRIDPDNTVTVICKRSGESTMLVAMAVLRCAWADSDPAMRAYHDAGILVPPQDEVSLANACIKLLGNPALRTALASDGRERVRSRFMVELSNERYGELYDDLVDTARGASEVRS